MTVSYVCAESVAMHRKASKRNMPLFRRIRIDVEQSLAIFLVMLR